VVLPFTPDDALGDAVPALLDVLALPAVLPAVDSGAFVSVWEQAAATSSAASSGRVRMESSGTKLLGKRVRET